MRRSYTARGPLDAASGGDRRSLDELDRALLESLDRGFAEVRLRAGDQLACRAGCDSCCHSLFPITLLDVRRLRDGMRRLRESRPALAAAIRARAVAQRTAIADRSPELMRDGRLVDEIEVLDAAFERHAGEACPALGADGTCELYAWRPIACRSFGPPLRFDSVDSAPCELCFAGADAAEIERCRFRPDPAGLERRALLRLGSERDWQALIAQALSD